MKTICEKCKTEFEALEGGSKLLVQKICFGCAEQLHKAKLADDVMAERVKRWDKVCPPLYRDTDINRIPDALRPVLTWKYGPTGLVIHGTTGKCKTRAVLLLLRRMALEEGRSVVVFLANAFDHQCARAFYDGDGETWIDSLVSKDIVFLDDLGKFKFTERNESELFGMVERRISELKPVIITTNFVGQSFEAKMSQDRGAPFIRRLREFCQDVGC